MLFLYNRKDVSGAQRIEEFYSQVVQTHVLVLSLIIFPFAIELAYAMFYTKNIAVNVFILSV